MCAQGQNGQDGMVGAKGAKGEVGPKVRSTICCRVLACVIGLHGVLLLIAMVLATNVNEAVLRKNSKKR